MSPASRDRAAPTWSSSTTTHTETLRSPLDTPTYPVDQRHDAGETKYSLDFILNMSRDETKHDAAAERSPMHEVSALTSLMDLRTREVDQTSIRSPTVPDKPNTRPRTRATTKNKPNGKDKASDVTPVKGKAPKLKAKSRTLKATSGEPKQEKIFDEKRLARKCTIDGCMNYTINKGLCFRHGGGKKCTFEDCTASAKIAGLCWKHGGSIQCVVDGCDRRGKSRGLCWAHGGGTQCQADDCSKVAVSNGFCWAHGGGKRCLFDGCERPAYQRTLNYCPKHFKRFESGEEVLEL